MVKDQFERVQSGTCLDLKAGVITVTVCVDSSDVEGVDCPTFQIRYTVRGGGAYTAEIMTSDLLGEDSVTESSI